MKTDSWHRASISDKFTELQKQERIALMPFLMAGDPDLKTSSEILIRLQNEGADVIEGIDVTEGMGCFFNKTSHYLIEGTDLTKTDVPEGPDVAEGTV